MQPHPFKEQTRIPDLTFPINIFFTKKFPLHWHDHLEWLYIKRGKVQVQIDATFAELREGELAFVNSRQLHGAAPLEEDSEMVAIVFNEALLRNSGLDSTESRYFLPMFDKRLPLPTFLKPDAPYIKDISTSFSNLVREMEKKEPGYELFVKSELFRIFGTIFRHYRKWDVRCRNPAQTNRTFSALLRYLRENYQQPVTVAEAAKRVNMSPNHFCSVFKKMTGKTLIEYVNLLRVNEAERLLLETDYPISAVSGMVGFGNLTYFGRVFKKYKGFPPSSLRKRAR